MPAQTSEIRTEDLLDVGGKLARNHALLRRIAFQSEDSVDYLQDVLLRILRRSGAKLPSGDCNCSSEAASPREARAPMAYLCRAVRNEALNHKRRQKGFVSLEDAHALRISEDQTNALVPDEENSARGADLFLCLWRFTWSKCTAAQREVLDAISNAPERYGHDGTISGAVKCLLELVERRPQQSVGHRKRLSRLICDELRITLNGLDQRRNRIRSAWEEAVLELRTLRATAHSARLLPSTPSE